MAIIIVSMCGLHPRSHGFTRNRSKSGQFHRNIFACNWREPLKPPISLVWARANRCSLSINNTRPIWATRTKQAINNKTGKECDFVIPGPLLKGPAIISGIIAMNNYRHLCHVLAKVPLGKEYRHCFSTISWVKNHVYFIAIVPKTNTSDTSTIKHIYADYKHTSSHFSSSTTFWALQFFSAGAAAASAHSTPFVPTPCFFLVCMATTHAPVSFVRLKQWTLTNLPSNSCKSD